MASFLTELSDSYTGAKQRAYRDELVGREFNLKMDKEARIFYGGKVNQIFNETVRDYQSLFNAEEMKEFHITKTGGQTFGIPELYRIAERKFDRAQPIPTDKDGNPVELLPEDREAREQARKEYANDYATKYLNDSGFASALAGPDKAIARLNYNPDRGTISPTLLNFSAKRGNVYEAAMSFGGKEVRGGGIEQEIPIYAADAELRSYTNEARNAAGFNTVVGGLGSLYGRGISARREKAANAPPLADRIGGPPSFDPRTALDRRVRNEIRYRADPNGDASLMTPSGGEASTIEDTTGQEPVLAVPPSEEPQVSAVSQVQRNIREGGLLPETPGTIDGTTEGAAETFQETIVPAPASSDSPVTSTTLRVTTQDGAWHNRKNRALDNQEIMQMARGKGGYKTAVAVLDSVDSFVYVPGTVPFFNAEQWAGMTPKLQRGYMRAAKAKSDKNIRAGFEGDLLEQGVSDLEFKHIPAIGVGIAFPGGPMAIGTVVGQDAVTVTKQLAEWERKHGEIIPLASLAPNPEILNELGEGADLSEEELRSAKLQTLVQIRDFYATEVADKKLLDVFKAHPAYFRQFKELGPVEFARKYINDPQFAKNFPDVKVIAKRKIEVNRLGKALEDSLNVSFKLPPRVPVGQTNQAETIFKTDLSEMIENAQPVSTALENATAALIQDQADSNLNAADFSYMTPKQRFILGYTIYGSMPEAERDQMRPNIDSLIEFGVLKTRLDRTSTPDQTAARLNTAYQTDVDLLKSNRLWFNNILGHEREMMRIGQTDTGHRIQQRSADMQALTAWRSLMGQNRRTLFDSADKRSIAIAKLARESYTRVTTRLTNAADNTEGGAKVTAINRARTKSGDPLKDYASGEEFRAAINILGEELAAAITPAEGMALSPIIDNAIYALIGAGTENDAKWWSPNSWGREVMGWLRGNMSSSTGDMTARFIAIDDQGKTIYDMNNIYHPSTNPNGQKVKAFRAIGLDGRTQRNNDMSAGGALSKQGQNLYYLLLSHAVTSANLNYN